MSTVNERYQEWSTVETARDSNTLMVRSFMVKLTEAEENMTDLAILALSDIPSLYSRPTGASFLECVSRTVKLEAGDKRHRIVTCNYEQAPAGADPAYIKPWERPAIVNYRGVTLPFVDGRAYRDDDGQDDPSLPIWDSAGTPFDTPPARAISRLCVSVSRAEEDTDFDPDKLCEYRETINLTQITVGGVFIPVKSGLMRDIRANSRLWLDPRYDPATTDPRRQVQYWDVTYEVEVSVLPIAEKILDQGPWHWVGEVGTGTKTPFIRNGREYDGKLNGFGNELVDPDDSDTVPAWRSFQMNFAKSWQPLHLPVNRNGT
jgi:hypothetical protein